MHITVSSTRQRTLEEKLESFFLHCQQIEKKNFKEEGKQCGDWSKYERKKQSHEDRDSTKGGEGVLSNITSLVRHQLGSDD